MIDWQTASLIAGIASGAVSSIDKIYRGYADFFNQKKATISAHPPNVEFKNKADEQAIVAADVSTGAVSQKVTYDDLRAKLNPGDRAHIEALSLALQNYEKQWDSALVAKSIASGMDVGRYDAQLDYLSRQIAQPLADVLDFVERMGLTLDDHYIAARSIARAYLKGAGV
jgi:hypothetical protein